jgi:hypothetical protein
MWKVDERIEPTVLLYPMRAPRFESKEFRSLREPTIAATPKPHCWLAYGETRMLSRQFAAKVAGRVREG